MRVSFYNPRQEFVAPASGLDEAFAAARLELWYAERVFAEASDILGVDYAIYRQKAAEYNFMRLYRQYKAMSQPPGSGQEEPYPKRGRDENAV